MSFSRREFLQTVGISAASASLFGIVLPGVEPALAVPQIVQGRALVPTQVVDANGSVVQSVWADAVLNIREHGSTAHAVAGGLVPREHIQPVNPYTLSTQQPKRLPFYAEVMAPVGVVRAYADVNAPLVNRVGHGGVLRVSEQLRNRFGTWYALAASNGEMLGWSQAVQWQPLPAVKHRRWQRNRQLEIDRSQGILTAHEGEQIIFQAQAALPHDLAAGNHTLHISDCTCDTQDWYGVPYPMQIGETPLHGAYWHNQFDGGHAAPTIELNTLVAKWLYYWAAPETSVRIL